MGQFSNFPEGVSRNFFPCFVAAALPEYSLKEVRKSPPINETPPGGDSCPDIARGIPTRIPNTNLKNRKIMISL